MSYPSLTMADVFRGINRFGNQTAVVFDDSTLTYADLVSTATKLATYLRSHGVRPGTPVAIAMSNCPEFIVADQALIMLGAAKVPINDMLSADEIDYIVRDSGAVLVIADVGMYELVASVRDSWAIHSYVVTGIADGDLRAGVVSWQDATRKMLGSGRFDPAQPGDSGIILYTGGTTGRQKGVVHTQSGLAINMLAHAIEMGLRDDEVILISTPLPHAAGLIAQAGLLRGAELYLTRRFDAAEAVAAINERKITYGFMVPTMIYRLLDRVAADGSDLPSLRTILYGAAPMSRARLEQGLELLGPVFMQLFGQTEAPDFLTRLTREDHLDPSSQRLASAGRAVTLMEVAIAAADGEHLPAGAVGEVVARGPYIMKGYHNLPDVTAETLRNGWLHTGDLGWMDDDGYLYLVDRLKDMIISGGMNVYSTEVENALVGSDGVAQIAVVGVPHPDWGEAVVAFVVPSVLAEFDPARLDAIARDKLAAYKRPKRIVPLDGQLPLTPYGKVDKKALRGLVSFDGSDEDTAQSVGR
jgi:fatty-acyl-CoA synthase